MKAVKNNRGITLISLVISIIMLLILSTITIMSLNGDDDQDIIEEAENTTIASEKIKIKEEVLFAVMQSRNINKEIDFEKLKNVLGLTTNDITQLSDGIKIEIKTATGVNCKFTIKKDGTITEE